MASWEIGQEKKLSGYYLRTIVDESAGARVNKLLYGLLHCSVSTAYCLHVALADNG